MADATAPQDPTREARARSAWTAIAFLFIGENARRERIAAELGLTVGEMISLFKLQPGALPTQRDLAQSWACDASWVTMTVDRLEELGLVERVPHPHDRRMKTVALTAKGDRIRALGLTRFYEPPASFDRLTDAEISRLDRLLAKLEVPEPGHGIPVPPFPHARRGGPPAANLAAAGQRRGRVRAKAERSLDKAEAKVVKARHKVSSAPDAARRKVEATLDKVEAHLDQARTHLDP